MASLLGTTGWTIAALVAVLIWALNHILNVYAESWKKRHAAAADEQLERLAKKAVNWKWHFRWIAILLGPSVTATSASAPQVEPAPASIGESPKSESLVAQTTAAMMLVGEVKIFKASVIRYGDDSVSRIDPSGVPLDIPPCEDSLRMPSEPIVKLERVEGGFRADTRGALGHRYTSHSKESLNGWIPVIEFANKNSRNDRRR